MSTIDLEERPDDSPRIVSELMLSFRNRSELCESPISGTPLLLPRASWVPAAIMQAFCRATLIVIYVLTRQDSAPLIATLIFFRRAKIEWRRHADSEKG